MLAGILTDRLQRIKRSRWFGRYLQGVSCSRVRVESRCVVTAKNRVHRSSRKSICTRSQRKPKICTPLSTSYKVTDLTDVTVNSYTTGDFSLNTDFLDLIDAQPPYCQLTQVHVWNDPLSLSPPLVCAGFQRETSLASEAFSPMR